MPAQPIDTRVEDLLSRMTLAEKIGQINMPCVYEQRARLGCEEQDGGVPQVHAGPQRRRRRTGGRVLHPGEHDPSRRARPAGGVLQRASGTGDEADPPGHSAAPDGGRDARPDVLARDDLPRRAGRSAACGTWTWSGEIYAAAAKEARAVGIHQLCTLVVEPIRDPRLGRNQEAYSEDPFFCSRMAETIVGGRAGRGYPLAGTCGRRSCATIPGQSQPVSGLERGAMEISERMLREVFLPPWEAGIKKAGALGVMATYPAIDGVPVHGSE